MAGEASRETWAEYRQQMLAETSRFIEWGLRNPHLVVRIPAKPVEEGGFPRIVSEWFWTTVLFSDTSDALRSWRDRLLDVCGRKSRRR